LNVSTADAKETILDKFLELGHSLPFFFFKTLPRTAIRILIGLTVFQCFVTSLQIKHGIIFASPFT